MKQADPVAQDMFEKAREAFFGTAKTSSEPSVPSVERHKPRNEFPTKTSPALIGQAPESDLLRKAFFGIPCSQSTRE